MPKRGRKPIYKTVYICQNCGEEHDTNVKFCTNCGSGRIIDRKKKIDR